MKLIWNTQSSNGCVLEIRRKLDIGLREAYDLFHRGNAHEYLVSEKQMLDLIDILSAAGCNPELV